jgi:hypothetical protein
MQRTDALATHTYIHSYRIQLLLRLITIFACFWLGAGIILLNIAIAKLTFANFDVIDTSVNVRPAGVTATAFICVIILFTLYLYFLPASEQMAELHPLYNILQNQRHDNRKVIIPSHDLPGGIHFSWPNLTADEVV